MSFLDIVSKFNQQATSHSTSQSLNPFSEQFEQSRSPSPRFSREEYGKPIAGSKTDLRGRKAKTHICREILELCTVIHDVGTYKAKKRDPNDSDDEQDDGTIIVSFGELFQIYTKISDKVVGLLIAAKRRGFVYFDREILFQRRDDDVLIALMKPISEISKILKDDISQTNGTAPAVETAAVEKKKSPSSSKTKRAKSSSNKSPATTDAVVNGNGGGVAEKTETEGLQEDGDRSSTSHCDGEVINGLPEDDVLRSIGFGEEVNGEGSAAGIEINAAVSKDDEIVEVSECVEDGSEQLVNGQAETKDEKNGDRTESESGIGESVEADDDDDDDDDVAREGTTENEKRTEEVDASPAESDRAETTPKESEKESEEVSNSGGDEGVGKVTEHGVAPLDEN